MHRHFLGVLKDVEAWASIFGARGTLGFACVLKETMSMGTIGSVVRVRGAQYQSARAAAARYTA